MEKKIPSLDDCESLTSSTTLNSLDAYFTKCRISSLCLCGRHNGHLYFVYCNTWVD